MTLKIVGTAFPTGGIAQAKDSVSEDARGRKTIETTYRTLYADWLINAPARGTTHPVYSAATLHERRAQQIEPGYLCDVTLVYVEPEPDIDLSGSSSSVPPDEYTESVNEIEVPIEAHPDFDTFATEENGAIFGAPRPPLLQGDFKGWTKSSPFSGYLSYKVGSVSESVSKYSFGKPVSVSDEVGELSGDGKWLTISGSITRRYPYWVRTIVRIYSKDGWNTTVYPN
jgi:hypothetical protein